MAQKDVGNKIPIYKVAISRGKRYFGKSKMNFNSLILHGLGAMSVFIEFAKEKLINGR